MLRRWSRNWLLWLALLLPVAQALAGVHALSHVDDGIVHLVDCDLCLTAAHLGAGAPAAEPAAALASPATHAAPLLARGGPPRVVSLGLPPARAPPASA
jgi:hypothetical protein